MSGLTLFLDIDGVLNDHTFNAEAESCTLKPECVCAFNRILREVRPAVVVTSAWRYMVFGETMTWPGFCYMLRTHGVSKEISALINGTVRPDTMIDGWVVKDGVRVESSWPEPNERGEQVRDWVRGSEAFRAKHFPCPPPVRYVVLDDLDLGFTAGGHPFVQTDGAVGLTEADADRVIAMLRGGA